MHSGVVAHQTDTPLVHCSQINGLPECIISFVWDDDGQAYQGEKGTECLVARGLRDGLSPIGPTSD